MINRQGSYANVGDSNPSAATVKRLDILRVFFVYKREKYVFWDTEKGK